MEEFIVDLLNKTTLMEDWVTIISMLIIITVVIVLAFLANFIVKNLLVKYAKKLALKTSTKIDDIFVKNKVLNSIAHLAPCIVIYAMANQFSSYTEIIQKTMSTIIILIVCLSIFQAFNSIVEYTRLKSPAKSGMLKGIMQVLKIVIIIFALLVVIVIFVGNSTAWAIVSGIGGMSAILILVFKDSILGLVAGFQLSSEKLLKVGDWLEMPKYNADGDVVDISLTKITVRNWDKTYTTIPAYKFIEDSFKNWEGMSKAGARRIKRSINIDMTSVSFLTPKQIEDLKDVVLLKPYLDNKIKELSKANKITGIQENLNTRKLTNIGTFRAYVELYLGAHPKISPDYTLMVRQLAPTTNGLPIEIYCFSSDIKWEHYEGIQADIFDHLLAIIPEFELKVFQTPTGSDFQRL